MKQRDASGFLKCDRPHHPRFIKVSPPTIAAEVSGFALEFSRALLCVMESPMSDALEERSLLFPDPIPYNCGLMESDRI